LQNVALKVVVTPVLIGGASLAGRRWGHQVGGWLVALPLTSGPVAFFLATDHGADFAASAAVGMLAATISQVAFAMAYRSLAGSGWMAPFAAGCASFAVVTVGLSHLDWSPLATLALVAAVIASAFAWIQHAGWSSSGADQRSRPPRWDIPLRMTVATLVVLAVTTLAPIIGPHLAGLLSPFPVFAVVLALFTHSSHGPTCAVAVLDGLVIGLAAPAVFFAVLALTLPSLGLIAFAMAAGAALLTQACTMLLVPADHD
jgi:hypothetical protein